MLEGVGMLYMLLNNTDPSWHVNQSPPLTIGRKKRRRRRGEEEEEGVHIMRSGEMLD